MDRFLELTYQGIGIGVVIAVLFAIYKIFKNRFIGVLLKNSKYAEKNQGKYFIIASDSITIRCGLFPMPDEKWIAKDNTIVMKPDKKLDEKENAKAVPFSKIVKISIIKKTYWMSGNFYNLLIWHKESVSIDVPLEHRNHNFALAFRPISLEAAQEIERQVNEHIASRK